MTAIFIQLTRNLYVIRLKHFPSSFLFESHDTRLCPTLSRGFSLRKLQGRALRTRLDTRASDKYLSAVARVRLVCLKSGIRKPHTERRMTLKFRD